MLGGARCGGTGGGRIGVSERTPVRGGEEREEEGAPGVGKGEVRREVGDSEVG